MPYATHETDFIEERYSDDMDLCNLLQTMKLDVAYPEKTAEAAIDIVSNLPIASVKDEVMAEDRIYQPDTVSENSSTNSSTVHEGSYGCGYLRAIRHQLEWDDYPTTSGEYLDAIFTHREVLFAHPPSHQECARGFSDLASLLENRAWRADREADPEAVAAYRHEAWVIASSLAPVTISPAKVTGGQPVCVMMPMF